MRIAQLPQLFRNAGRFREVVSVMARYGIASWLGSVPIDWIQRLFKTAEGEVISKQPFEVRVREALQELGTTFIKFGQILSTRPDLVGTELADELSRLQTDSPADAPEKVRQVIAAEFEREPEQLFDEFDETAFASGSVGQVHHAVYDGKPVVVKVLHSGIESCIANDIDILQELARLAETYSTALRQYQPVRTTEHFCQILRQELDFARERENLRTFDRNFADDPQVRFPKCVDAVSGRTVLTMELLDGATVGKVKEDNRTDADLRDIAQRGAHVFLTMVFRDRFFHADPHPGNLMVLADDEIGIIDAGMVGSIDEELSEQLEDLLLAAIDNDVDGLHRAVTNIGRLPDHCDHERLRTDISGFVDRFATQSIRGFDLSGALSEMVTIIHRHHIMLPEHAAMLIKTLVILEGTAQSLNPDFSLAELITDYRWQIMKRRYGPARFWRKFRAAQRDWVRLAGILPADLSDILHRLKEGRFDVHLDHRRLDSVVNRLVAGILAAALFVGSSFLYAQRVPPCIGDYSIPGIFGCLAGVALGIRVLRAIRSSGNLRE